MRLSDVFNTLATGELSNLFLAEGAVEVKPDKKEPVLRSINLALTDLYNRFFLKRKEVEITTSQGVQAYAINDPLLIEIHKVVFNGRELCINKPNGYHLLSVNTLVLKDKPEDNQIIEVIYKAKHKTLTQEDVDNDVEIELPDIYLNALCLFIGSRVYTSIVNQLDGDLNESNRYAQRYMQEIAMLNDRGVDVDSFEEMWLFDERGFI
ncbi:hypothetical protein [Moraxella bovis]|uniref:Uncharacterized protein n=1 Tax=Moraxella bovis TaxID=476 RepID=A0ABY6M7B9_MORBO|nr:hypothetical protein [Moraxella bovis]UZA02925.1 hypothetical protein LP092_13470 [Moraxella bovis]UZA19140.1 hypothetical protein LP088_12730 [Moraxella bovis]UZA54019.1 hypothetical protein LP111_12690 [Moraxella bovis]UZA57375.1 hypothetical protein LP127_01485 [Moraxella bovis]